MEVKKIKIAELKNASYNPKTRTDAKASHIKKLMKSIEVRGLIYPVAVDKNMNIIDGHRRVKACKLLGWEEVPVLIMNTDDKDGVYADINSNALHLNGYQTIEVFLKNPNAVTLKVRKDLERLEETFGREALIKLVDKKQSTRVMHMANCVASYCDKLEDSSFRKRALRWLMKYHNRLVVQAYIKIGQSPKTLYSAVMKNQDLKAIYT